MSTSMSAEEARADTTGKSLSSEQVWLVPPPTAGATKDGDGAVLPADWTAPVDMPGSDSEASDAAARARLQQWGQSGSDGTDADVWESDPGQVSDTDGVLASDAGLSGDDDEDGAVVDVYRSLADVAWEAVATDVPGAGEMARIVRKPLLAGGHVILDVCTPEGTFERRVPSKGKLRQWPGAYRAARRSDWGAQWPNWLARKRDKSKSRRRAAGVDTGAEGPDNVPPVEIVWPKGSRRDSAD